MFDFRNIDIKSLSIISVTTIGQHLHDSSILQVTVVRHPTRLVLCVFTSYIVVISINGKLKYIYK